MDHALRAEEESVVAQAAGSPLRLVAVSPKIRSANLHFDDSRSGLTKGQDIRALSASYGEELGGDHREAILLEPPRAQLNELIVLRTRHFQRLTCRVLLD